MVRKVKAVKKKSLPPIQCKGCDINFVPKDRRHHFHSEICREDYYRAVYFSKSTTRKQCPNCGVMFMTSKPKRQVYCTPECREDAANKRQESITASMTAERTTFLGDRFSTLEKDSFKCVYCGKSVSDRVKLEVEDDGKGGLHTVCSLCLEGRNFNSDNLQNTNLE